MSALTRSAALFLLHAVERDLVDVFDWHQTFHGERDIVRELYDRQLVEVRRGRESTWIRVTDAGVRVALDPKTRQGLAGEAPRFWRKA